MPRRRRKIGVEMLGAIREAEARGLSSREVHAEIVGRFENPPSDRAIRDVMTPRVGDTPWALGADAGTDTPEVGQVAGEVLIRTEGRRRLSLPEARWVAKIYRVVSDIPPWTAYLLAREYFRSELSGEGQEELDAYLALRIWERGLPGDLQITVPSINPAGSQSPVVYKDGHRDGGSRG